jgi:hypothetical protein
MGSTSENLYAKEYLDYLKDRGAFRKLIRKLYLRDIRELCVGKTIDFGCGTGELLSTLLDGSIGFEVNIEAVNYCISKGLQVKYYDPDEDEYELRMITPGEFTSLTMNHVLEHLENSVEVIKKLFKSCARIGIKRIVFTVPGSKGFKSDKTHRTFIDVNYFRDKGLLENRYFQLRLFKYFPINNLKFGTFFTHNELRLVFDKKI